MQEDQISVVFIASLSCVYFTHKEDQSQFHCLQISERKLFPGAGGHAALATTEQKGRTLKLKGWDASSPLLTPSR